MTGNTGDRASTVSHHRPVWLVTGASKGIGRDVVEAAAATGAHVVAGSRDPDAVTAWVRGSGLEDRVTALALDISSEDAVHDAVADIVDRLGGIDVLINNAGYLLHGGVEELSDAEVRRSFDVNVFGLLTVTRHVLPVMRAQRAGRIVNMSSISANVTTAGTGLYSATKAAVLMFSEALDAEGRDLGIRVTAVCPGGVRTDFLDSSSARRAEVTIADYASVHTVEQQLSGVNHRQGGDPRKVADVIVALTQMEDPPSRIYLGADALTAIERHLRDNLGAVDRHRRLSLSTTAD